MVYAGDPARAVDIAALNDVAWSAFTPTWTNLSVGNGTQTSDYIKVGRLVVVRYDLTLGSTSTVAASAGLPVTASVPVAMAAGHKGVWACEYRDSSAGNPLFNGTCSVSGGAVRWTRLVEARTDITSTSPFTWATGDSIGAIVVYESA